MNKQETKPQLMNYFVRISFQKMNIDLYGIKSCDKVRSAIKWLKKNQVEYKFFDLKSTKLHDDEVSNWLKKILWSELINKKSATWRALSEDEKERVKDSKSAKNLFIIQPLVMKRPIIKFREMIIVGYSVKNFENTFGK